MKKQMKLTGDVTWKKLHAEVMKLIKSKEEQTIHECEECQSLLSEDQGEWVDGRWYCYHCLWDAWSDAMSYYDE